MSAMTRYEEWIERLACGEQRLYIVAEVANAHEGSLEMALRMVAEVTRTGADGIDADDVPSRSLDRRPANRMDLDQQQLMPFQAFELGRGNHRTFYPTEQHQVMRK